MCPIQWDRVQLNWTWFFSRKATKTAKEHAAALDAATKETAAWKAKYEHLLSKVDLQLQLAPLSRAELAFMLQARTVRVHGVRVARGEAILSHTCCPVATPRRARRRSRPPSCSPASCCCGASCAAPP